MARCPACSGLIRATSALRCPYCGASLADSETRSAATETLTGAPDAVPDTDTLAFPLPTLGEARFAPGRVFASRFRIVSLLGRGAMGEVYRADDLRLGQSVALKLLTTLGAQRHDALARFAAEVRLARAIAHPNVCRVFDIGEAENWHYLSMEYVDGETLASVRERIGRLPPEKANDVARQLCAGLAAAHEHGVLHRDLKPANIMLDGRGRVRIMDFGLAMRAGDRVERVAGTAGYIAPEQLSGKESTERSDLYSLGLVLYEIFSGTRAFRTSTLAERARALFDPKTLSFQPGTDPRVIEVIRTCLAADPAERPPSALHIAAHLPGGDAIATALADGRVPTPDIVASSAAGGGITPAVASLVFALVVGGLLLVAARGERLTVTPADIPKPPQVLAERSRQLLASVGDDTKPLDHEYWFDTSVDIGTTRSLRFIFRTSPLPVKPSNLLNVVTRSDPPMDVPGMAIVTLDPSGKLLAFSRIVSAAQAPAGASAWADVFREAGLDFATFDRVSADRRPPVPHDDVAAWVPRQSDSATVRVTGATLAQRPVDFDAADQASADERRRNVISTRRSPLSDGILWVFVIVIFTGTAIMVRRNLRAGEGDLNGARTLATVVVGGGVLSILLQAHHVLDLYHELIVLLSGVAWSLLWGGFSWLAYVAFEPHVRRLWPRALITWTRVLSGRVRDPLVGRDLLVGMLAGTATTVASLLIIMMDNRAPSEEALAPALASLRSSRLFASRLVFLALDSVQFALGGLFMLLFLRLVLRRTWVAVVVLVLLNVPLTAWNWSLSAVLYALATAGLFGTVVLRIGLFAVVVMLATERLLTRLPITLDFDAWYIGSSVFVLLLVLGVALWAFRLTLLREGVRAAAT
jgi:serine/threonine protein kinase